MNTYKIRFDHGIMFHHFHDNKIHFPSQGSIDKNQLNRIINLIGKKNILNPNEFFKKLKNKNNKNNKKLVCLTFDDGLKSQIDVALPVLKKKNIKAFFFIYSSIFTNNPDNLEIYRFFRTNYYKDINQFYYEFFKFCPKKINTFIMANKKRINQVKKKMPFYSINDIKFRLVRDFFLKKRRYELIMNIMLKKKKINKKFIIHKLVFNKLDLKRIINDGHSVGLHSHTHPTQLNTMSYKKQMNEYFINKKILKKILSKNIINSMSHPCGSYNELTFKVLKKLGIKLGFKQINTKTQKYKVNNFFYDIPREDHSNIIRNYKL